MAKARDWWNEKIVVTIETTRSIDYKLDWLRKQFRTESLPEAFLALLNKAYSDDNPSEYVSTVGRD